MPVYAYRREDGTTFEIKQKFLDEPLTICPTTGQSVIRIVTAPGIIFKGSGFYVTDNAKASKASANGNGHKSSESETTSAKSDSAESSTKSETKSDSSPSAEAKKATA